MSYGPDWTTAEARGHDAQRRIAELEQQLAATQAEALELREKLEHVRGCALRSSGQAFEWRDQLIELREVGQRLARKWRGLADKHKTIGVLSCAIELEKLVSPAPSHDPLAVSDHCPDCSEPEPECVCDEQPPAPAPELPRICCRTCEPEQLKAAGLHPLLNRTFVVCPQCHNKRCPKAEDHRSRCTGSNEPGQVAEPEHAQGGQEGR